MQKRAILFMTVALFAFSFAQGQISKVTQETSSPKLYERTDFTITLKGTWSNPYLQEEAALDLVLTLPSGKQIVQPCFYETGDSGKNSTWKARFTPREVGTYNYYFLYTEKGEGASKTEPKSFNVAPSNGKGFLSQGKNFWTLSYDNGQPFRGIGENICWESREHEATLYVKNMDEVHKRFNYDVMLPKFSKNGGNFIRIWMSTFPIDSMHPQGHRYQAAPEGSYYNPSALERMDHFFDLLKENDIYVMLCLGGGRPSSENMFVSEKARQEYKNRLRFLIARYSWSPNLAYWEFFNEIDNVMYNRPTEYTPEQVVAWHTEMSKYLKDTDPNKHLVTTSISHRDLPGLNYVANIDLNQMHIYKHTSSLPIEIWRNIAQYNKPYVIGEFGYEWDWNKNFNTMVDEKIVDFKRGLWYGIFNPTPITPMSWWWEFFDEHGMVPYFNSVRQISDRMLRDGNGDFKWISAKTASADAYAVVCGNSVYAYAFNKSTEVIEDRIALNFVKDKEYKLELFNPTTQTYTDGGVISAKSGFSIPIPALQPNDEIVVICTPIP